MRRGKEEEVEKESFAKTCEKRASPAGRDFNSVEADLAADLIV